MLHLAEKIRVVRGDQIHQLPQLLAAAVRIQQLAILLERIEVQLPEPLAQPARDQRLLVLAELDAAVRIDLLGDEPVGRG